MKNYYPFIFMLFLICTINVSFGQSNPTDIAALLPAGSDEWSIPEEPERYNGEDLYFLINGGADLFLEYGFIEVIAAKYVSGENFINVEIYEMEDSAAAYGVFTIKKYSEGECVNIGKGSSMLDSYLIFWKDKYSVIINGSDIDESSLTAIKEIAEEIESKIINDAEPPAVTLMVSSKELKKNSVKYVKGMLGLNSTYVFGHKNIFGFNECVIADYPDYKLFIMGFDSESDCADGYKNAVSGFNGNKNFSDIRERFGGISFQDRRGKHLTIQPVGKYIVLTISEDEFDPALQIESIKANL